MQMFALQMKMLIVFLSQGIEMDSFNSRPTALNSGNLDKLQHVLDYRCIVGGGEQLFLLALGVRNISLYLIFI